jgi:hypothetical protein
MRSRNVTLLASQHSSSSEPWLHGDEVNNVPMIQISQGNYHGLNMPATPKTHVETQS